MYALRTRFKKQIVCEFLPPIRKTKRQKVIIFCSGMPSNPGGKYELLYHFAKLGYWAFFPRYRGTWESSGEFLKQSPHLDIKDILDELPRGFIDIWNRKKYAVKAEAIVLVGNSFGGPAVILNSNDVRVSKVIGLAPVIDWTVHSNEEPMELFYENVRKGFGGAYRFTKKNWNKFNNGTFYNPISNVDNIDGNKILIIQAQDDTLVNYKPAVQFSKLTGATLKLYKKGGHHIKVVKQPYYNQIMKFINL